MLSHLSFLLHDRKQDIHQNIDDPDAANNHQHGLQHQLYHGPVCVPHILEPGAGLPGRPGAVRKAAADIGHIGDGPAIIDIGDLFLTLLHGSADGRQRSGQAHTPYIRE